MPIIKDEASGEFVLRCVNHPTEATMRKPAEHVGLDVVSLRLATGVRREDTSLVATPFCCRVCNYVELYLITDETAARNLPPQSTESPSLTPPKKKGWLW